MELTDKDIEQLTALWEGSLSDIDRRDVKMLKKCTFILRG
jgi:hypothetical protein